MGTKTQHLWAEGAAQNKLSSHPEQQKTPTQSLPFKQIFLYDCHAVNPSIISMGYVALTGNVSPLKPLQSLIYTSHK